ncbi:MAG: hypothetical protein NVS3B26_08670 [Mycobacteriales bacterium]
MTTADEPMRSSDTGWPSDVPATPPPPDPLPAQSPPASAPGVHEQPEPAVAPAPAVGDDTSPPPAPLTSPARSPRATSPLRSAPVLALLLMTVLMAAATAVVWYQVNRHDATETARRQGLETSRDAARVLFSYDYRTLPKDFSAGLAITTGRFRAQYADTTSKVVTPVATAKRAVVKAEVVTAGVVRATPDTVVTIVYVNQVTTSSLQPGPKVDLSRVRMTVRDVGGQWLISNVEAL